MTTPDHEPVVEEGDPQADGFPSPSGPGGDGDTTTGILEALRGEGVVAQLTPGTEPATMRCSACDRTSAAADFEVVAERRMEGTSDPDDMVLIVAARCPACGSSGAIVLGYGPEASAVDTDLVMALAG